MPAVIKTKDTRHSYYFYRHGSFNMDICKYVVCLQESGFDDLTTSLMTCPEMDETTAVLGFESGTSPEKVCQDLEAFIRHVTRESAVVALDLMSLYKSESEQEMLNILSVFNDYMLSHWGKKHVMVPPIVARNEMGSLDKIVKIQTKSNSLNMEYETPPVFPFSWVMKSNARGLLVHVISNWVENGAVLSKNATKRYVHCILTYLKHSINEGLCEAHDLTSRIEPQEVAVTDNSDGAASSSSGGAEGQGPAAQDSGNAGRGRGLSGHGVSGHGVSGRGSWQRGGYRGRGGMQRGGNRGRGGSDRREDVDLRIVIAKSKVKKEVDRLKQLLVESATRKYLEDFFKDISHFK